MCLPLVKVTSPWWRRSDSGLNNGYLLTGGGELLGRGEKEGTMGRDDCPTKRVNRKCYRNPERGITNYWWNANHLIERLKVTDGK